MRLKCLSKRYSVRTGFETGNLVVDVNARQLDLHGYGLLSYFPARIEYRQNFTHQHLGSLVEKQKLA